MISSLEMRHIIEAGMLPLECRCTINPDASMTIQITDPETGRPTLTVTGIATGKLTNARAISDLVGSLRQDFSAMRGQAAAKG